MDERSPLVSIVIPVYNVEEYLDECLNSVRHQTYDNLEIILIEDGSTDGSMSVLQSHLKEDKRIKLIVQPVNQGVSVARNTGIEAATGNYILFVDSDDVACENLVSACVKAALETGADMLTFDYVEFKHGTDHTQLLATSVDESTSINKQGDEYFRLEYFPWLRFIRADVLQASDIRFPVGIYYEDWLFHWHLGFYIKNRYHLSKTLYYYRKRKDSITDSKGEKWLDLFTVQQKIIELLEEYRADKLKPVLVEKIVNLNFYLLINIDKAHIASALKKAMTVEKSMQKNNYKREIGYQVVALKALAKMPETLALPALKAFRLGLHDVFFPTRQSYRQWRQKHKQQ